ncbi:TPA: type VI secretion system tip protein VgrG [Klebsiella pneumoniae]|uniref:type VI secretion system tip protein VgrG n=2 Tax=Klebsiella pneumoniae TaxID=573 RepID=UPI001C671121|nr:type VI secretion system tip protein VgrG [Klebsiella pneumoniae]MBK4927743.1 type VI secretion system tip protein VgrG [Klebsiella pneumoniae]MDQ4662261.1 type VI secretion system tip protein VgrG [Klebsiella pneumoniae]
MKSLLFSHNHHLLSVKGCEAGLDVLAFEGDEALSQPFRYRIEFTSADHAISKEMMLMKAASLTLQAPVAQGFGINVQQPVRVIQGVVTGFERLSTSRDETHYALTLQPRLALLNRSHQNAIYQDQSVPQIVEKILRERHGLRGQDFLFSLTKTYPRREQVMQYGEDDLRFITRLLGEVGIWFRFTADTRLHIDVAEFCDSQQGYEKGLTLPSVPPSGQQSAGVDAVWEMACRHRVVEQQVSTRDYSNFADVSLEDMTSGTDARRLFTTDEVVPGMFTRQAWEGGIQQAIDKVASSRREEIDWVLSDSRKTVSTDLSPEALKARLTRRYFTDFAGSWLNFLNSLRLNPATNIADVTDQLTLISDVRQSPLIALMNTLAWQGQAGQQREGLSDSLIKSAKDLVGGKDKPVIDQSAAGPQGPLDDTFGPLLQLMGKNTGSNVMSADSTLSLQTYLTRITRVRLRLQQVANASDPQEMMQTLAQTVFQGKSVDLTDTQQYGSLISASLGEEWSGFGNTLFVQPLTQAWETVLLPSATSLNDKWRRSVVANWHTAFDGRFPFAASKSDASLPMLAEFVRKDSGRIERFLTTELNGVLHKEGSHWVPDKVNSHGLVFNPAFLRAINQLSQLSDILFTDGSQGISFELQARPAPEVVETQLTIDGQKLRYFNQMVDWQTFRWPGETYKPGTLLTWTTVNAGTRLFGDYSGTWGFIRWLEQGKRHPLDRSQWMMSFSAPDGRTLQWVLRSQLESGPLALLALRGLTLPDQIFTVDAAESAQALTTGVGNSDMDEMEL